MGKSSKDKRDIYYRLAKEAGYRARSAYKLMQLDDLYGFLHDARRVIDLCAAPGSWSQVVSQHFAAAQSHHHHQEETDEERILVSVDLQPMAPLPYTIQIQADLTHEATHASILTHFARGRGKADVVLCDGAPDVTGLHDLDTYLHYQLFQASLTLVRRTLKTHGTFVAKMFRGGGDMELVQGQVSQLFTHVSWHKPLASRSASMEVFLVCQDFMGGSEDASDAGVDDAFMECGDLSAFNSA